MSPEAKQRQPTIAKTRRGGEALIAEEKAQRTEAEGLDARLRVEEPKLQEAIGGVRLTLAGAEERTEPCPSAEPRSNRRRSVWRAPRSRRRGAWNRSPRA